MIKSDQICDDLKASVEISPTERASEHQFNGMDSHYVQREDLPICASAGVVQNYSLSNRERKTNLDGRRVFSASEDAMEANGWEVPRRCADWTGAVPAGRDDRPHNIFSLRTSGLQERCEGGGHKQKRARVADLMIGQRPCSPEPVPSDTPIASEAWRAGEEQALVVSCESTEGWSLDEDVIITAVTSAAAVIIVIDDDTEQLGDSGSGGRAEEVHWLSLDTCACIDLVAGPLDGLLGLLARGGVAGVAAFLPYVVWREELDALQKSGRGVARRARQGSGSVKRAS